MIKSFECCLGISAQTFFSLKVIALFHLKYKAESNPGPFPTSYMELFVTIAIFAKGSVLDIGRGPR